MAIKIAKRTGFCFGVKRAVTMAEAALEKNDKIYSLGSIIHNKQVVEGLAMKGLKVINDMGEIKGGTVVISSHGLSPKKTSAMAARGIEIIDTTCPFVLNAQRIAKRLSDEGYWVVIVGDVNHPEIKALVDFASKKVCVVKDKDEAEKLKLWQNNKIGVLSQTTQDTDNFLDVVKAILAKRPNEIRIFNTICNDAEQRQEAARRMARSVNLMLIVGGRNSANTRRLFEVCKKILPNSHLVQTEREVKKSWFKLVRVVGITSGASTPDWMVERIIDRVKSKISKERGCIVNG